MSHYLNGEGVKSSKPPPEVFSGSKFEPYINNNNLNIELSIVVCSASCGNCVIQHKYYIIYIKKKKKII